MDRYEHGSGWAGCSGSIIVKLHELFDHTGSKLMSRRTERPYKVDGMGELARHSAAPCSVPEINGPVVQQEFTSLLREICGPSPVATPGAELSNELRAAAEVSEGIVARLAPRQGPNW